MIEWIASLSFELKVFYGIAITSLLVVVIQMGMTLLGLGFEAVDLDLPEFDFDADGSSGSSDPHVTSSGLGFFSTQTIGAFFLGFGWTGVVALTREWPMGLSVFLAFSVGGSVMLGMYFLLAGMLSLQGKGNLVYHSALGRVGEVYVTIPGSGQDGGGQIQILIQNRLTIAAARKVSPGALLPGAKVRVVGMAGATTFRVEPLAPES